MLLFVTFDRMAAQPLTTDDVSDDTKWCIQWMKGTSHSFLLKHRETRTVFF